LPLHFARGGGAASRRTPALRPLLLFVSC
jgi:hypothetical protein